MVVLEEIKRFGIKSKKRGTLTKRLIDLANKSGYDIIQTNGQRIYAPPASKKIKSPSRGCEVFIGKLNKTIYEDELIPLFELIGPIYKFRMMLDFTERTRGYAFATYFTTEDADKAVEKLNNYEIRPKLCIGVYKSVDNCRLFIGNIPIDKTRHEVLELLKSYASGVADLIMFQDFQNPKLNRGFVFLEFENHRYAAMARRQFTPNNLILWNKTLYVDWADPLPDVDPKIMMQVTILYLSNVPADFSSNEIRACICNKISTQIVSKVYKRWTYAFIHFTHRSAAEYAYSKLQDLEILGRKVSIEWARPRCYSKKYRPSPPENFCTSVPPNLRRIVRNRRTSKFNSSTSSSCNQHSDDGCRNSCGCTSTNVASGLLHVPFRNEKHERFNSLINKRSLIMDKIDYFTLNGSENYS